MVDRVKGVVGPLWVGHGIASAAVWLVAGFASVIGDGWVVVCPALAKGPLCAQEPVSSWAWLWD